MQNAMQKDEPKFTDPIRGEMVCFASSMISTNGVWQGDDPFEYSLPLFILQLMLIVVITRILIFLLKPLRQPKSSPRSLGLGGLTRVAVSQISRNIAVLFFGGPDDREALSYAWRMARHPGQPYIVTETETERLYDDKYITDFRLQNVSDENCIHKKFINNAEETVVAVRSMENIHDLYIVGRGQGMISPLIASLNDWSECPELGAIGDLLASSDSAATISVLVVQQYVGGSHGDGLRTPDSQLTDNYDNLRNDTLPPSSSKGDSQSLPSGRINTTTTKAGTCKGSFPCFIHS
ncbi:hypothetical protein GIB67_002763 [Kingdonia uniflora]|uniref:Cation/H(+) antiporter C-terminal domain-containing protein n=1 Tax=Kingdonia uniflora TaxID=39325 RepID=A0A7J7MP60_9MAGN|nr:hypothetical protein GIB67_002763 [Kingdonia uniflora]